MHIELCEIGACLPFDHAALVNLTPALRIIVTDDYLRPEVAHLCANAVPSLLVRPASTVVWIGPLLHAERSICYDCLCFYLALRYRGPTGALQQRDDAALPLMDWPVLADVSAAIAVLDPHTGVVEHVPFASRTDCPRCHTETADSERRVAILSHPLTGIVENVRIEPIPGSGLHMALGAILLPPQIRLARGIAPRASASGSGRDARSAHRVLTFEAAERYSAEFDGSEVLVTGAPIEATSLALSDLLQFSETQYGAMESEGVPQAPQRLAGDRPICWAIARSLVDGSEAPMPAGYVYLDYSFDDEPLYYVADTCGCAASDSNSRAVHHALLESVERDALAIWWYNRISRPLILPSSPESHELERMERVLKAHGRSLSFFDLTHDIGIPVVAAISADANGKAIYMGAAADLSAVRACERAARELLQFWFWDRAQDRVAPRRRDWIVRGDYATFPFLDPSRAFGKSFPATLESRGDGDTQQLVAMLLERGLHSYVIDLTRPAIGLPAVRVIVPGLRHHGRRLAPGRLFDVPTALGWLPCATRESEINPYPVPL